MEVTYIEIYVCISVGKANNKSMYVSIQLSQEDALRHVSTYM